MQLSNDIIEEIKLAKNCKELTTQSRLARSVNINVRRALAKNKFLDTQVANRLLFDPSANISYLAQKNKNCTIKREFLREDLDNLCVICEKDELVMDCSRCG